MSYKMQKRKCQELRNLVQGYLVQQDCYSCGIDFRTSRLEAWMHATQVQDMGSGFREYFLVLRRRGFFSITKQPSLKG